VLLPVLMVLLPVLMVLLAVLIVLLSMLFCELLLVLLHGEMESERTLAMLKFFGFGTEMLLPFKN